VVRVTSEKPIYRLREEISGLIQLRDWEKKGVSQSLVFIKCHLCAFQPRDFID
jgi:hypothetical protein